MNKKNNLPDRVCLKLIKTLELLGTSFLVQTPHRGFASAVDPTVDFRPQIITVCRRDEEVPEHPFSWKSTVIMLSFALLAMLGSAKF